MVGRLLGAVERRLSHASVVATLALLVAFACACGSADPQAERQARIKAALARLERGFEREKAQLRARVLSELEASPVKGLRVTGKEIELERKERLRRAELVINAPRPKGVTSAEWNAAIARDAQLDELILSATPSGGPSGIEVATPAAVASAGGRALSEYDAGKRAVAESGCLACHKIGANGNAGPGPNLTHVGARLPKQAIARTLVNPTAPMPSFKHLPPARFHAIVVFLSELK